MEVIVRKAEVKDAKSLVELNFLFNEVKIPEAHVVQSLRENRSEHVFVASVDNVVVGFATVDIHFSFCYELPNGELTELFVKSEFRGKGIAKGLLREAFEVGRSRGVEELHLRTSPSNEAANELYKSLGMRLGKTNVYYAE